MVQPVKREQPLSWATSRALVLNREINIMSKPTKYEHKETQIH